MPVGIEGTNEAPSPLSVTGQPLDVPQLRFMFFISASTVLCQVVFGRAYFRFHSGVQWNATLVMELASLRSTCTIQRHRFLVMMVSISSCWHRAKRSQLEMVLGQNMRWIFLKAKGGGGRKYCLKEKMARRAATTGKWQW